VTTLEDEVLIATAKTKTEATPKRLEKFGWIIDSKEDSVENDETLAGQSLLWLNGDLSR